MREWPATYTNRLQCVECDRISREGERGWTAHLTTDEDEPVDVVAYCPECDAREFRSPDARATASRSRTSAQCARRRARRSCNYARLEVARG